MSDLVYRAQASRAENYREILKYYKNRFRQTQSEEDAKRCAYYYEKMMMAEEENGEKEASKASHGSK
jgi:hypothetical protein